MTPTVTIEELRADPHPRYRKFRRDSPVVRCDELDAYLVCRWEDVRRVCTESAQFTADQPDSFLTRFLGRNMLHSEGPTHRAARALVLPAFRTPPTDLTRAAREVWANLPRGVEIDLLGEFCGVLVSRALTGLLGLEEVVADGRMTSWGRVLDEGAADFAGDTRVGERVARVRADVLSVARAAAERQFAVRPESVVGCLLAREEPVAPDEVARTIEFMVLGGDSGPREGLGTVLALLATSGAPVRDRLSHDTRTRRLFVEEALRWECPIGAITRRNRRETTVAGTTIPAGATVLGVLSSANRDETRWRQPDVFDPWRDEGPHLSFGAGAHGCVGAALTRHLARALLDCLPALETATILRPPEYRGWWFRGPDALPAVLPTAG
ncbi:cytochrome P450 [Actinophytocola sp.]|uniref:cytochrome P450 n=1 Tax=Actinophytocola sp. TaxID=1872138 RepID=UPI002EDB32BD